MPESKGKTFLYPANERGLMMFAQTALFGRGGAKTETKDSLTTTGHLLVTGAIGSGKSTFVQRYLEDASLNPAGYMTIRHINKKRQTRGFSHVAAGKQRDTGLLTVRHQNGSTFPDTDCFLLVEGEKRLFDIDHFVESALPLIERAGDVIVMDELGGDELLDNRVFDRVMQALDDTSRPLIIVWKHEKSLEQSLSRSNISDSDRALLKERRHAILTHASLTSVMLESDGTITRELEEMPDPLLKTGQKKHLGLRFGIMGAFLIVLIIISFAIGWYWISPITIIRFFWSQLFRTGEVFAEAITTVLVNVRPPRIALALLVGSGLSVAGHTFQGVFQNPMVSPDVLGASSGASFGAALAILAGFASTGITLMSFVFGLISIALVLFIASFVKANKLLSLVLTGIVVSSLFSAGLSLIKFTADPTNQLPAITYWLMGSLNSARLQTLSFAAPPILLGIVVILLLRWQLNLLALGEEAATTMGVRTRLIRMVMVVSATLVTATCVSVSGVIGWIGLVVPHISRMIVGSDNRVSLPASALIGASFLLFVDNIARRATTAGIPLGILTAFIGAPFFVFLILREGRKGVTG